MLQLTHCSFRAEVGLCRGARGLPRLQRGAAHCKRRVLAAEGRRLQAVQDEGAALALSDEEISADVAAEIAEVEAQDGLGGDGAVGTAPLSAEEEEELRKASELADNDPTSYALSFLWLKESLGVAVDQVYAPANVGPPPISPLTEYFFWPTSDAWGDVKDALEKKPWISELNRVLLLNQLTEVITMWQNEEDPEEENQRDPPPIEDARSKFPQSSFLGS